jgi:hypothetical protein
MCLSSCTVSQLALEPIAWLLASAARTVAAACLPLYAALSAAGGALTRPMPGPSVVAVREPQTET